MNDPATQPPTLTSERLVLRPFELDDAADVQRLAGAWQIAYTTLNIPHPYDDGLAEAWISGHRSAFAAGKEIVFAITLQPAGQLVGAIGLVIKKRHRRGEMGYWIGVDYWNQGYATEAAWAVLDYGFRQLGLNRIYAYHFTRNPASGRVMEKIGMRYEGRLRQHVRRSEAFEDLDLYAILSQEYDAQQ
jgi:ribosomal-protein-alanine N-acetyltransferase